MKAGYQPQSDAEAWKAWPLGRELLNSDDDTHPSIHLQPIERLNNPIIDSEPFTDLEVDTIDEAIRWVWKSGKIVSPASSAYGGRALKMEPTRKSETTHQECWRIYICG